MKLGLFLIPVILLGSFAANADCKGAKFEAAYELIKADIAAKDILAEIDSSNKGAVSKDSLCFSIGEYNGQIQEAKDLAQMTHDSAFKDAVSSAPLDIAYTYCHIGVNNSLSYDSRILDVEVVAPIKTLQSQMMTLVEQSCPGKFVTK